MKKRLSILLLVSMFVGGLIADIQVTPDDVVNIIKAGDAVNAPLMRSPVTIKLINPTEYQEESVKGAIEMFNSAMDGVATMQIVDNEKEAKIVFDFVDDPLKVPEKRRDIKAGEIKKTYKSLQRTDGTNFPLDFDGYLSRIIYEMGVRYHPWKHKGISGPSILWNQNYLNSLKSRSQKIELTENDIWILKFVFGKLEPGAPFWKVRKMAQSELSGIKIENNSKEEENKDKMGELSPFGRRF